MTTHSSLQRSSKRRRNVYWLSAWRIVLFALTLLLFTSLKQFTPEIVVREGMSTHHSWWKGNHSPERSNEWRKRHYSSFPPLRWLWVSVGLSIISLNRSFFASLVSTTHHSWKKRYSSQNEWKSIRAGLCIILGRRNHSPSHTEYNNRRLLFQTTGFSPSVGLFIRVVKKDAPFSFNEAEEKGPPASSVPISITSNSSRFEISHAEYSEKEPRPIFNSFKPLQFFKQNTFLFFWRLVKELQPTMISFNCGKRWIVRDNTFLKE